MNDNIALIIGDLIAKYKKKSEPAATKIPVHLVRILDVMGYYNHSQLFVKG